MPENSLQHTPSGDGDRGTAGAGGAAGGCGCPGGAGELRPHGRRAGATEAEMGSELGFHYCQSRGVAHLGFQRAGASHPPLQQSSSCCGHSKRKAGVALSKAGGQAGLQERAFTGVYGTSLGRHSAGLCGRALGPAALLVPTPVDGAPSCPSAHKLRMELGPPGAGDGPGRPRRRRGPPSAARCPTDAGRMAGGLGAGRATQAE